MAFEAARSILSTGTVSVGLDSIHYAASGVTEAGSGILFLHESAGNGATWNGQLVGLAQKARCLVPDLPGHGQSVGFGLGSVAEYRDAMIGLLDALAIRWPVVVAGVGLGAAIAIDLALEAPERVAGLILTGIQYACNVCPDAYLEAVRQGAPDPLAGSLFSDDAPASLREQTERRWRSVCPMVRYRDLIAFASYPLRDALRRLSHRTLLVAGEHDRLVPPEAVSRTADILSRGEAVTIEGAGGLVMVEQPERYNRLVAAFLAEVRPAVPKVPMAAYGGGYRSIHHR